MENKPKEIIQNVAQKEELDNMSKREEDRQDKKSPKYIEKDMINPLTQTP